MLRILSLLVVLFSGSDLFGQSVHRLDDMVVKQVIDDQSAILTLDVTDYWYQGDVTNWVDDDNTKTCRYVIADGTHRFETVAGGTRTVRKLRDLTRDEIKKHGLTPIEDDKNPDVVQFGEFDVTVVQVLSDSSALVTIQGMLPENQTMFYRGRTDGWVDSEYRAIPKSKMHGIHRYKSVSGSTKTVRIIQEATDDEWAQHLEKQEAERMRAENELAVQQAKKTKKESDLQDWKSVEHKIGNIRHKDKTVIATDATVVGFVDLSNSDKELLHLKANTTFEQNHAIFTSKKLDQKFVAVSVNVLDDSIKKKLKPAFDKAIEVQESTGVSFAAASGIGKMAKQEVVYPDRPTLIDSNWRKSPSDKTGTILRTR